MNSVLGVSQYADRCCTASSATPHCLLIYCTAGACCMDTADHGSVQWAEGELVVIPPNIRYRITASDAYADIRVQLSQPSFSCTEVFLIDDHPHQHLRPLFEQLLYFHGTDVPLLLDSIGDTIANHIAVLHGKAEQATPVKQICDLICKHYDDPKFALDIAIHQMPFHYDYLRKLFKKKMGVTPQVYQTGLRMKKARVLLSTTCSSELTVSEIAHLCGYDDPLYFSRVFKKYLGVSPAIFRRNENKEQGD